VTVHDFATVLEDSSVLVEVAADAGITPAQARRFCALMGERPAEQVIRILGSARDDRVRRINHDTRKSR